MKTINKKTAFSSIIIGAALSFASAQTPINDTTGTVNLSTIPGHLNPNPGNFVVFEGVSSNPILAKLIIDEDVNWTRASGSSEMFKTIANRSGAIEVAGGNTLTYYNSTDAGFIIHTASGTGRFELSLADATSFFVAKNNIKTAIEPLGNLVSTNSYMSLKGTAGSNSNLLFDSNGLINTGSNAAGGGVIYSTNELHIDYAKFDKNYVNSLQKSGKSYGGAIHSTGNLYINNSIFAGNKSYDGGSGEAGAIYSSGAVTDIRNTTFSDNLAQGSTNSSGGALSLRGGSVTLDNVVLERNKSLIPGPSGSSFGGAIDARVGYLLIKNSKIEFNEACNMGGAVFTTSKTDIENTDFTSNVVSNATSSGRGGALYASSSGPLTIKESNFKSNFGDTGGAIYASSAQAIFTDVNFENNSTSGAANATGGALHYMTGTLSYNVTAGKTINVKGNKAGVTWENGSVKEGTGTERGFYLSNATAFNIDVASTGILNMEDSIYLVGTGKNTAINKTGDGLWKLGGSNEFIGGATIAPKFAVKKGTLQMLTGSTIKMTGTAATFTLESGVIFDARAFANAKDFNVVSGKTTFFGKSNLKLDANSLTRDTSVLHTHEFALSDVDESNKVLIEIDNITSRATQEDRLAVITWETVSSSLIEEDANDYFTLVNNTQGYTFTWDNTGLYIVIPEPSTYALIFGLLALGFVAYRRRK